MCDDAAGLPPEMKKTFSEGCQILQSVVTDLVDVLREAQLSRGAGDDQPTGDSSFS
jgi:hypothetical protein